MPRRLPKQTWGELKKLFVAGWSIGQLAKRFGVPKGTIAAHAAREKWSRERIEGQTLHDNNLTFSDDPRMAEIQMRDGQSIRNAAKITGKGASTVWRVKLALTA